MILVPTQNIPQSKNTGRILHIFDTHKKTDTAFTVSVFL